MKFKYVMYIILAVLFALDFLFILLAKYFVEHKKYPNKFDFDDQVLKLKKIGYLIFAGLTVLLILVSII